MVAMHIAILVLSLALLVPQAIAQSISFLPPSDSSAHVIFLNATNYDLFKNSNFTANCSFNFTPAAKQYSNTSKVHTTFAGSQSEFCAKLNSTVPWFVWPTTPTPAAYLPNWVGVFFSLVVLCIKSVWVLVQCCRFRGHEQQFGKFDVVILFYDIGQFILWWYCTIAGFSKPLHANWVNPIQWLTPSFYAFFVLADILPRIRKPNNRRDSSEPEKEDTPEADTGISSRIDWRAVRIRALVLLVCIFLATVNAITGLVFIFRRFRGHLGSGSYIPLDPFPDLPAGITSTCRDLLHNPASPLYTDPHLTSGRLTQAFVAGATIFVTFAWAPVLLFALCCSYNVKRGASLIAYGWGICVQFIVLIWLAIIASRGVPLMLHEECGVVVIAMSPARGYLDSKLHYEGLKLQAAREAFGICESLYVQIERHLSQANGTLQRHYILDRQDLFPLADGRCFDFFGFLTSFF